MLTFGELISAALKYGINAGTDSAETDQKLRDRAGFHGTQSAKKAWSMAPMWYRLATSGSITITTSSGPMSADFSHMGVHGQITDSRGTPLQYLEPGEFYAKRASEPNASGAYPEFYTLGGKTSVGLSTLQVHPPVPTTAALTARGYVRRMPDLIDRPNRVTTTEGAAGNLSGAYLYKVTFVNALGETEPGVVSVSRSVTSKKIELSGIPTSTNRSVTSRKIYRTVGGGSAFKLLTTISNNTETTYSDNVADGSLTTDAPTLATAVTGIEVFPDDFVETVLLEGLTARLSEKQGDLRANKFEERFEGEVKRFWAEFKQGQNVPQSLPPFGASSYSNAGRSVRDRLMGN